MTKPATDEQIDEARKIMGYGSDALIQKIIARIEAEKKKRADAERTRDLKWADAKKWAKEAGAEKARADRLEGAHGELVAARGELIREAKTIAGQMERIAALESAVRDLLAFTRGECSSKVLTKAQKVLDAAVAGRSSRR